MADYHIAPNGIATGDGSVTKPWDIATGIRSGKSRVLIHGGTYNITPAVSDAVFSTLTGVTTIKPYPGESPVIVIRLGGAAPAVRKVPWPTTESAQNRVLAEQRAQGYVAKRNLFGPYAEFEKL